MAKVEYTGDFMPKGIYEVSEERAKALLALPEYRAVPVLPEVEEQPKEKKKGQKFVKG